MNFLQTLVFVVAAAVTAYAYPGDLYYGGALNHGHQHVDYYAHPHYNYDYAVHDLHTGDVKNKWESRDGDVVKGSYSLNEPDGTIRQVDYTADGHNGFNAVVKKIGKAVHPQPVHYYGGAHLVRPAIAVGHLGAASYAYGNNYALNHYGGYHY